jgi:hypothetical protein
MLLFGAIHVKAVVFIGIGPLRIPPVAFLVENVGKSLLAEAEGRPAVMVVPLVSPCQVTTLATFSPAINTIWMCAFVAAVLNINEHRLTPTRPPGIPPSVISYSTGVCRFCKHHFLFSPFFYPTP